MSTTDSLSGGIEEPENVNMSEAQQDAETGIASEAEHTEPENGQEKPEQGQEQQDTGEEAPVAEQPEQTEEPAKAEEKKESKEEKGQAGFGDLDLPEEIVEAVAKVGFERPSPIQAATIPTLMQGRDVVGLAQTGTGKTAAFALPILARLDRKNRSPQALVLAPTRELALQVADSFQSFVDHVPGDVSVLPIYGGQAYGIQLSGLRRGAQIIVGTPGRVIDHLEKGSLDISGLRFLVLDEADEMLKMGFQEDVERILEDTPDSKQTALFSATMPSAIRRISKQYLVDPEEITVKSETRTAENIRQRYLQVSHRNKLDALTRILEVEEFEAMILFVRTKHETEELAEKLRARGFSAAAINGDIVQSQRERTIDQLKDGRLDILVATDVAARGLDVDRISHVVNFDIPHDSESYVHRIGRTGRAGRSGEALLFVTPRERRLLRSIERATRQPLKEINLPTVDEVNESRKQKFADSLTKSLEHSEVDVFRGLIQAYAEANDIPVVDVAAALATQANSGEAFFMKEQPRRERDDRRGRDRGDRGERRDRRDPVHFDRNGRAMSNYKLDVGRRDGVRPGAIVGALANEGGLTREDFGHISIRPDFTLVELPEGLPQEVFDNLADTRIAGRRINIQVDPGAPAGRPASHRRDRDDRGGRDFRDRGDRRGGRDRDDRRGGRDRDDRRGGGWRGRDDRDDRRGGGNWRGRDDRRDDRGDRRGGRDNHRGGHGGHGGGRKFDR